jgi:hypothetical protein
MQVSSALAQLTPECVAFARAHQGLTAARAGREPGEARGSPATVYRHDRAELHPERSCELHPEHRTGC